jgi:tRNA-(ms[2]io[6]A)-hydroxylase
MFKLRWDTPSAWTEPVLADFDAFLRDHASCERKAHAQAMRYVAHYPDQPLLVAAMLELAAEELDHVRQVYGLLRERGLHLERDRRDAYVHRLREHIRQGGRDVYLLDQLLVSALVEARSCERFRLLTAALPEGRLRDFYLAFMQAEARHHALFVRLAREQVPPAEVDSRLGELLDVEAEIACSVPFRAAVH